MEARQFEEVVACAPSDEEIAEQKTNAMVEDVKTIKWRCDYGIFTGD